MKGQLPLLPDTLFDSPRETQATANQGDFPGKKTLKQWQLKTSTYLLPPFFVPLLLDPQYPLDGLCHPLSQALFCLFPGQFSAWFVEFEDGDVHLFLRDADGQVVDLVSYPALLCDEDYDAGERVHWRPRSPTQRTRTLLARAGLTV